MAIIQTTLHFLRTDLGSFSTQDKHQSKLKITSITKLAFIFLYCFSIYTTQAQVITNGGFENLDSISYKRLNGFITNNQIALSKFGTWNATSMPGKNSINDTGFVLKNHISETDTLIGFISNIEKFPFSEESYGSRTVGMRQTFYKISINYNYMSETNDSAFVRVILKYHHITLRDLSFSLPKSTNQLFELKTIWNGIIPIDSTPTNYAFYIGTSNPNYPANISQTSELKLKSLFIDIPKYFNPSTQMFYLNPISWVSHKGYHAGHRDAYLGKGALALSGLQLENGELEPYTERNYQADKLGNATGGAAYSLNADTLLGYYKFKGNAQSAKVRLMLLKNQQMIFDSFITIASNGSEYTPFMLPFNVDTQPDTLRMEIISNNPIPTNGDTLLLDEIQMASARLKTNIQKINQVQANFGFYPNPTSGILYPINPQTTEQVTEIYITDMLGKKLKTFNPSSTELSINELPAGIYFLHLQTNKQARFTQKIVKE
ncbi:MAG: T9SS type A sorting domain-containing protein [Bacteroidota bacterium]|nr:T9SS type A sorting domain-containing protein [Bacteroidota bacterium]